jgi:hypothetical protein
LEANNNGAKNSGPDRDPHLSGGAIAGVTVGVVAVTAGLAALFLWLLSRRKREKVPDSPGIYPQEAYLYDPPITPENEGPGGGGAGGAGGAAFAAHNINRSATPEMAAHESSPFLAGAAAAGGAMAAGAAARGRRGTMSGQNSPRPGFNGYAPVENREITEAGAGNPFNDPANEYSRGVGASDNPNVWPLNPNAPSGLGTPPGTAAGPSGTQSGSQTPRSMYRDSDPGGAGPSIAGVGSQRYERRISANTGTGNLAPGEYNPAMREARRAWGLED